MLIHQPHEVGILRHDDHLGVAGGHEKLKVRRALQVELTDGNAVNRQRRSHPPRERRWELIVEPERHAATMG